MNGGVTVYAESLCAETNERTNDYDFEDLLVGSFLSSDDFGDESGELDSEVVRSVINVIFTGIEGTGGGAK